MFTDDVIEAMVTTAMHPEATDRERQVYCEALRSLVNLAKVEAIQEMNAKVQQSMSNPACLH